MNGRGATITKIDYSKEANNKRTTVPCNTLPPARMACRHSQFRKSKPQQRCEAAGHPTEDTMANYCSLRSTYLA